MIRTLFLAFLAATAWATDVPVFRYALERWEPSPHLIDVAATASDAAAVERDLAPFRSVMEITVSATDATETRLVAHLPQGGVWYSGPWRPGLGAALADSPARSALVDALVGGASVVWLLVDDGGPAADATAARLRARLDYLGGIIELPEKREGHSESMRRLDLPHIPIAIDFRIQRLRIDDPTEISLIQQLQAMGDAATSGAFAVPVFGRGRALERIPLADLTDPVIDDLSHFALGPCSCQVKDLNPGEDILIAMDWYERLLAGADEAPRGETVGSEPGALDQSTIPETVLIRAPDAGPSSTAPSLWSKAWIPILVILTLGIAAAIISRKR